MHMTKDHLGQLLSLAQTDRERECIKYAVFKTSGLSASAAWKFYGFSDMIRREQTELSKQLKRHSVYVKTFKALQPYSTMYT